MVVQLITPVLKRQSLFSDFHKDLTQNPISEDLAVKRDEEAVKESIKNLILTDRGERLMQPLLGSSVRAMLFENNTPSTIKIIQEMIKDAELNAESDKQRRTLVDRKNSAEALLNETASDLEKYGDKITEEEKGKIDIAVTALTESVKGKDAEDIQTKISEVYQSLAPLTGVKYKAENPEPAQESTDGVVDVDATEVKSA